MDTSDYSQKTVKELIEVCKEKKLVGYSGKKREDIITIINNNLHNATVSVCNFNDKFVFQTMLTCIGNKRKLVSNICNVFDVIKTLLSKDKLNIVDGFAGSSVVSRALTHISNKLYTNDMELYSYIMAYCYLVYPTDTQKERIIHHIQTMNMIAETGPYIEGIICKLYSPKDTKNIKEGERCFYTRENAVIIDTLMKYIEGVEPDIKHYLMGPLLIKASINVNTAGVFRGFYKKDGIGHFGGAGENALERILAPIQIEKPIWSSSLCKSFCYHSDINELVLTFDDQFDVIYLDPPYNEHPYGSNYFMLNLIANGQEPVDCSKVSGIPKLWNKSAFNGRNSAFDAMVLLLTNCLQKARYVLISYNNEGLITDWSTIFQNLQCNVKKYEKEYCEQNKDKLNEQKKANYEINKELINEKS